MAGKLNPNDIIGAVRRAMSAFQAGNLALAEQLFRQALDSDPRQFEAMHFLGVIASRRGQQEEAERLIAESLKINWRRAEAHANYAKVLLELKRFDDALITCDRALKIDPRNVEALTLRGNVLASLGRHEDALASIDKAISIKPDYFVAHAARGNVLKMQERMDDALAAYNKAISISPRYAAAHANAGEVLLLRKNYASAFRAFDSAISFDSGNIAAWEGRAESLLLQAKYSEAARDFEKIRQLDPNRSFVVGWLLYVQLHHCDWAQFESRVAELLSRHLAGEIVAHPFSTLCLPVAALTQMESATRFVTSTMGDRPALSPRLPAAKEKLRVAYMSADFRDHPVGWQILGLIERHDRARFEIIGVSFGYDDKSDMRARLAETFDQFHDLAAMSDRAAADFVHGLDLDILVDLQGHTEGVRYGVLARRPAPVQVGYLGYAATTGGKYLDYVIADGIAVPPSMDEFFSEKIIRLPESFFPPDVTKVIADPRPSREEHGLPPAGFVFCCFNADFKILPGTFDIWMRLLRGIPGSVLWLSTRNETARSNLRKEAQARGVDPGRLVFASRTPRIEDHLARLKLADLFLDTLPYNAHTTAADALWSGLPVLTCVGETFAGRVAASLLSAVRLPELITSSPEEYAAMALRLAREPDLLKTFKGRLADPRSLPLFDLDRLCRDIESAYTDMWDRHVAQHAETAK